MRTIVLLSLFTLVINTGYAQDREKVKIGKVDLNDDFVEVQKKPIGVAFRKLNTEPPERKDQQGRIVKPTDLITLPNGRRVPSNLYYAEVERLEREFNAKGYSIEDDSVENVVGRVKVNKADLQKLKVVQRPTGTFYSREQINQNFQRYKTFNGRTLQSIERMGALEYDNIKKTKMRYSTRAVTEGGQLEMRAATSAATSSTASTTSQTTGTLVKEINKPVGKSWTYGSVSSFQAKVSGNASLKGKIYQPAGDLASLSYDQAKKELGKTKTELNFSASSQVDGTIFKKAFNLLSITANARVPANADEKIQISVGVSSMGANVYNYSNSFTQNFDKQDRKTIYRDASHEYRTVIVVVPVSGEVGVKGNLGVEYRIYGDKQQLRGMISPFVELSGYAEAAIDIIIAEAGVRGTITFVKGKINIEGDLVMTVHNDLVLNEILYAGYEFNFLAGKLELYAKVPQKKFWKGWKHYSYVVWEDAGFNLRGSFSNYNKPTILNW